MRQVGRERSFRNWNTQMKIIFGAEHEGNRLPSLIVQAVLRLNLSKRIAGVAPDTTTCYNGTGANELLTSISLMYLSEDRLKMSSAKGHYNIF